MIYKIEDQDRQMDRIIPRITKQSLMANVMSMSLGRPMPEYRARPKKVQPIGPTSKRAKVKAARKQRSRS